MPAAMQSVRRSYEIAGRMWSLEDIRATADAMLGAQQDLLAAIEEALGPDTLQAVAHLLAAETAEHRGNG
jgi:hypothetical protein